MSKSNFLIITVCITEDKEKCIFPFGYQEVIYHECIDIDLEDFWCPTAENATTYLKVAFCGDCTLDQGK